MSVLGEQFDQVFFLYSPEKCAPSSQRKTALSKLVQKLFDFPIHFLEIKNLSIQSALDALSSLWKKDDEYLIDITGGDEAFIAAAGILSEQKGKNVTLHQYDVFIGKKLFSYPTAKIAGPPFPHYLSVPEILALNGSVLLSAPSYVFNRGPMKNEVLRLWNAVKNRPKEWNRYCALSDDQTQNKHNPEQKLIEAGVGANAYHTISQKLKKCGILSDEQKILKNGRAYMEFTLNVSDEAKFLYDKAGNILEMYCALCAHESGLFHDIRVGVMLDWNGTVTNNQTPDPRNEVDLFLMRENLPVVVSCKNTAPKNEHLYEIMIMAKHYGGFFATPALFASGRATDSVRKRAAEMGVVLLDGIRFEPAEKMVGSLKKHFEKIHLSK